MNNASVYITFSEKDTRGGQPHNPAIPAFLAGQGRMSVNQNVTGT
jgi:hypothetical protein